jgi:hypothetical protein
MKLILVLLLFVKFSFAYQFYSAEGYNFSDPNDHDGLYKDCKFNRDIKPSEINDADIMKCVFDKSWLRYHHKILYCEPPKFIDENNECVLEIDPEQWKNVFESSLKSNDFGSGKFINLENEDSKKKRRIFGKRNFSREDRRIFAAIGKTSEGKYELLEMETCLDEILTISRKIATMAFILSSITPQLMSIICYLILLVFYLMIGELKKTIYGKCWINFIFNSLINYSVITIHQILLHSDKEHFHLESIQSLAVIVIIALTEFYLYVWLNIALFEASHTVR